MIEYYTVIALIMFKGNGYAFMKGTFELVMITSLNAVLKKNKFLINKKLTPFQDSLPYEYLKLHVRGIYLCTQCYFTSKQIIYPAVLHIGLDMRKPDFVAWELQRPRPACILAQVFLH